MSVTDMPSCAQRAVRTPATSFRCRALLPLVLGLALLPTSGGCFSERSFPLRSGDLEPIRARRPQGAVSARQWLSDAHRQLRHLLPEEDPPALLSDDMIGPDGRPLDVFAHFDWRAEKLETLTGNLYGFQHTARCLGTKPYTQQPAPAWPGFQQVWIPVEDRLSISGRLGLALEAEAPRSADCIIILPGLFGDNGILRTRDLAVALRQLGWHVLALEYRGHGQTEGKYPDFPYVWGLLESDDLITASEWLKRKPCIQRTGLVGYSWSAGHVLLMGWYEARQAEDPSITPALAELLRPRDEQVHFQAGILSISPVLRYEDLIDQLDRPHCLLLKPALGGLQRTVRQRVRAKGYPQVNGSLRQVIRYECQRLKQAYPDIIADSMRFLRLLPYKGHAAGDKLAEVRVPTLIIHACNDPLIKSAQDLADLMATVDNPNVAAVLLPGGGHVGFPAYCRSYYFSLIVSFFDPEAGPTAETPPAASTI